MDDTTRSVARLARAVFGIFDAHAWEATRRGPFASIERINSLRTRHNQTPLTSTEYEAAKAAYYERYPTARR